ncbi:hypothetical protein GCM10023189_24830 [Nibrella saemangeumensis]|uniref:Outer membrane protein beta-barrel domain-containing protein n=1 Tax=Nibrella saemangeumensis TaxID=1084526 RepID=A0ABP8MWV9_9BACT
MKRLLLLVLLLPTFALAQKKIAFGLKVGANFSQLNTLEVRTPRLDAGGMPVMWSGQVVYDFFQNNDSKITGLVGGAYLRLGSTLYIQPELLLSSKGGSFDLVRQGLATQRVDVKMTTFDIPVLVGLKLGPLRLNAGPMASLRISDNQTLKDAFRQYTNQPVGDTYKQAVFGYQAGVGLSLFGLQLDLRREGNFSDLAAYGIKTSTTDERFSARTSLWQITAGFGF